MSGYELLHDPSLPEEGKDNPQQADAEFYDTGMRVVAVSSDILEMWDRYGNEVTLQFDVEEARDEALEDLQGIREFHSLQQHGAQNFIGIAENHGGKEVL
jgi:hypothetical protein